MTLAYWLLPLVGPVYFAIRDWPVGYVVVWTVIWMMLRILPKWRQARTEVSAIIDESRSEAKPGWLDNPHVMMALAFVATTAAITVMNVLVFYWVLSLQPPAG